MNTKPSPVALGLVLLACCGQGHGQAYTPAEQSAFTTNPAELLTYPDPACEGDPACTDQRAVQVTVRTPDGLAGPRPVVIWSHGGASGHDLSNGVDHSTDSLRRWGELTASAGYVTVTIAHSTRDIVGRERVCEHLGIALASTPDPRDLTCELFKFLNHDRPYDIARVLDRVDELAILFPDTVDNTRIAVGGHSAGSGGTQSVAGALREFGPTLEQPADPRADAFMAFSPQRPGQEGFFDPNQTTVHSWQDIDRPVLVATGSGDGTCNPRWQCRDGDSPWGRRAGFDRMPPGDKYLLFVHDVRAPHSFYGDNPDSCVDNGHPLAECAALVDYVNASALAFLDAYLKNHAPAQDWVSAGTVEDLSNGVAEWVSK